MKKCKAENCSKKYHAKDYCKGHYRQFRRWGSLTAPPRPTNHYLFPTWSSMRQRCNNPKHTAYKNYGGRGIKVCERWLEPRGQGFWNFIADMGERPPKTSIDRTNNDGGYNPGNCRWATAQEQAANRRGYSENGRIYDFSMIKEDFNW